MVANSLLSCNSFSIGLKLPSRSPSPVPPVNTFISRRSLFFRRINISAPSTRLEQKPIFLAEMQSSANKSTAEPVVQEDTKKIRSDENALDSRENTGLNFRQLASLVNIPIWAKFVLGSVVLLAIPILRKSNRIKDVTKTVEEVAEAVEKAAEITEKVAEEIAEALPEGNVKEAALKLEKIALLVDKEAEFTESIIDKVDDVVEAVDANLKLVEVENKKNDEAYKTTLKKIVVDQSKEALQ